MIKYSKFINHYVFEDTSTYEEAPFFYVVILCSALCKNTDKDLEDAKKRSSSKLPSLSASVKSLEIAVLSARNIQTRQQNHLKILKGIVKTGLAGEN